MKLRLVATCALGLEEFLEAELAELGYGGLRRERGAVTFQGRWRDAWQANWRLRTANRVLVELATWDAEDGEALARGAEALVASSRDWDGMRAVDLFHPQRTFSIRATSSRSRLHDNRWVGMKLKDGLVDAQRRRYRERASVDRKDPDLRFRVWLARDRATLLVDTSGESLDRRGYRVRTSEAPVREQLAATCILASGWDGVGSVVDPMCGSGTLLAEAASIALGRAPGFLRESWAFERLPGFNAKVWAAIRNEAIPAPGPEVRLYGVDHSPDAISAARANLEKADLQDHATIHRGDGFEFEPPPPPGLVVVNPPYGERLEDDEVDWRQLGDLFKKRYKGYQAVVLAGGESRGKQIGLKPKRRIPVRNGALEARILLFDLY
jgi:putative N6-adenine-specific DNA methylase